MPLSQIHTTRNSPERTSVKGKFLYNGNEKFYIKGVTYGTFAPGENGSQFPPVEVIIKDFAQMAQNGINAVRTYTTPSLAILDLALNYGLKVMVGLPWEQHINFLDTTERKNDIIKRIKNDVISCKKHPAILCYTIGNEIPAPMVRWYGKRKIEGFLKCLFKAAKQADPEGLVTYVNYPTTEYLDLSFLDFDCFNVYLETPEKLGKYISRLHNLSGDRPLVLAEIGLDSLRNGHEKQSEVMDWQIKTVFGKGCAGMFVFAWTDEWWRGGYEIDDWDFGLVDRQRKPKPALFTVAAAMANLPVPGNIKFPFFSVIVCSYNGSATIRDTLEGLQKLTYPNFEVIVVNDGSKDNLAAIVGEYNVKLITTTNKGLSSARNTGMYNARGEILAYLDDDAYPDPHWLHYLAYAYENSEHGAMGGPNILPPEDGPVATCVANAPGGPVHVLETDELAEHVPGCNLSVRKKVLMEIGGFDPVFRSAGDDVDVCWRIQQAGYSVGFHPSALVWHHRRNSFRAYWKQQKGYGKAEALLERKWPERYNGLGHLSWAGRIYGNGFTLPINVKKGKVFYGSWGSSLFQSVYQPADGFLNSIPLMPEWYLFTALFGAFACLGFLWPPLLVFVPVFVVSIVILIIQAIISTSENSSLTQAQLQNPKYFFLIVLMHILQPVARLRGRIFHGLTPWRIRGTKAGLKNLTFLKPKILQYWSEGDWKSVETWLEEIEQNIINQKAGVKRGGDFDRWDIRIRNGLFSTAKAILTVEEHGANKQYIKLRYWVNYSFYGLALIVALGTTAAFAAWDESWIVSDIFILLTIGIIGKYVFDSASVVTSIVTAFKQLGPGEQNNNDFQPIIKMKKEETETGNSNFLNHETGELSNSFALKRKIL